MPNPSKKARKIVKSEPKSFLNNNTVELLKNKTKFQIIINLLINNEMSMTELSKTIKKSKSTVHRHLQELIDEDLIKVSKEKQVRGSIHAKYYILTEKFYSSFELESGFFHLNSKSIDKNKEEFQQKIISLQIYLEFVRETIANIYNFLTTFVVFLVILFFHF